MAYPAQTVANFFIKKAKEEKDGSLDLMKLSKEVYIAHGWSLALFDDPLIDEPIEAWQYGPVIPSIYHSLKHNGLKIIREPIANRDVDDNGDIIMNTYEPIFDPKTQELLDAVYKVYRKNTGVQLANWSHQKNSPWYKAWHEEGGSKHKCHSISNENIKAYFLQMGSEHESRN